MDEHKDGSPIPLSTIIIFYLFATVTAAGSFSRVGEWDWLRRYALSVSTAEALVRRSPLPPAFIARLHGVDASGGLPSAVDNAAWAWDVDEQLMQWAVACPEQWQAGGKCSAYLWGSGRNGQLGEAGELILSYFFVLE